MHVRRDAFPDSKVPPLASILTEIQKKLSGMRPGWSQQLQEEPSRFGEVEVDVHHTFQQLADQVVAGLLAEAGQAAALETASKKSR